MILKEWHGTTIKLRHVDGREMRHGSEGREWRASGGLPRLAASSYLNSAPVIWSFLHGTRREGVRLLTDAAPARCADMLARGEAEVALVPVIEYQRLPEVLVVPDVCIGAWRAVRSVVLATRCDNLEGVRTVALDESSRTSAALVQIIFREFFKQEIVTAPRQPDLRAMLDEHDAALLIGDPAMTFPRENLRVFDLASLWRELTGFGFVFAMWMAHAGAAEAVRAIDFAAARDEAYSTRKKSSRITRRSLACRARSCARTCMNISVTN